WTQGSVAAQADTQDFVGVYGRELTRYASTPDWALDGYHGSEPNLTQEVVQFGARHLALRDGLWMQPEPLLYLGLTNGDLGNPLGYTGLYAGGNPNVYQDRTGRNPLVAAIAVVGGFTAAEVTAAAVTSAVVGTLVYSVVDPQGSQQAMQAVLDTADFAVDGLRQGMSTVGAVVGAGLSAASGQGEDRTLGHEIAHHPDGHAWDHALDGDFGDISDKDDLADLLDGIISNPEDSKELGGGRQAWLGDDGTIVIHNPDGPSTAFNPDNQGKSSQDYWDDL
ncbi:MAG: hypothetical protein ABMB14_17970, partial [Myxococcota bacterium]